ncbi:MAG TPA: DUF5696 domain-containing protein [Candidatus Acidoferrales bacterium]|jgi:hypothetical protein|nr:DUF5696 domain-containing protein [Candidatus Acidoferrales bacterium]
MKILGLSLLASVSALAGMAAAADLPRADWGAPLVTVAHADGHWTIAGKKQTVTLDEKSLALEVNAQGIVWKMPADATNEMVVKADGREFPLHLADAKKITIEPYDTGFKTGVKVTLGDWPKTDLKLFLTICLQGDNEEVIFDSVAQEGKTILRQLDWPPAMDARDVDDTVLSNNKGDLLPRNWPKPYYPVRATDPNMGTARTNDHSVIQSHLIEDWSMSWWGFERNGSAMMVIIETPDDAAYQFDHPPGGPTVIGPRWLPTLGKFGYLRTARMCFFPKGNYVTLAKRYRQYVQDTGLFVSLKEKIAKKPVLGKVIGIPQTRVGILHNQTPTSDRYSTTNHYELYTFDQRAQQLRDLKAAGIDKTLVYISGWAHLGYDRQHPDSLPPPEAAGGWDGMKRLADTCTELGYPYIFHDQYRDYYTDAPSYNPDFAIHEETTNVPAIAFAGSRFGDWKEGQIPFMRHWDGGPQSYLNSRFQVGHLEKNYQLFFAHGVHPQGIYIDVIGYVPPDEDFNPEHPTTRTDAMRGQADLMNWAGHNLGITSTEAGSDWVVPFSDIINQSGGLGRTISVPLYQLVYHDAVLISYGDGRRGGKNNLLLGLLCGGIPELPVNLKNVDENSLALLKQMAALNRRVGLLEMTGHEFLDATRRQERSTFADGTTVTVDWDKNTAQIAPPLN